MSHRIAPPNEMPTHALECSYLRQLAVELTLLNSSQGTGALFHLCGEWRTWRGDIAKCPFKKHQHIIEFVNSLMVEIEALWSWPPPADFKIDNRKIQQLRQYTRELNECFERVEIKY